MDARRATSGSRARVNSSCKAGRRRFRSRIRRMFNEMHLVRLSVPEYHQTSGSVRLTLTALSSFSPEQQAALPRGAEEILSVLRRHEQPLGTGDIVEATGRSRPWVRAQLEELRTGGIVRWEGKSPRDPRATWSLPR